MSKYEPLKCFLQSTPSDEISMTFGELEKVLGKPLPPVARRHRAWWSNNPSNSVITNAWLEAGFQTARVNMVGETLVFLRKGSSSSSKKSAIAVSPGDVDWLTELRQKLAGMVAFVDGADLTEPTGEVWDAER